MKLGIKTTGGTSRVKIKTEGSVTKAVECACCGDPCSGLWGPGYDDWPDIITVLGCRAIGRVGKCRWVATACTCELPEYEYLSEVVAGDDCSLVANNPSCINQEPSWLLTDLQLNNSVWNGSEYATAWYMRFDINPFYWWESNNCSESIPFNEGYTKFADLNTPYGTYVNERGSETPSYIPLTITLAPPAP